MKILILLLFTAFFFVACKEASAPSASEMETSPEEKNMEIATVAGGCFWCVESDFEKLPGVHKVISGYTGGTEEDPNYKQVSAGMTGHLEAIQIYYDPTMIAYKQLLDHLWRHIDPTDAGGQFVDQGPQYRSAIFYHNEEQQKAAEASKESLDKMGTFSKPIVTEIIPFTVFYEAETYHQDYYKKNPLRYTYYRHGSGRDQFLEEAWKDEPEQQTTSKNTTSNQRNEYMKPDDETLRKELTDLQYRVTQLDDTEPPFRNEYWDNKKEGIYVDIVSGEPLFASSDKFDSGTGWPSYTKPLEPDNIVEIDDFGLFAKRTEVRSKHGSSHLGHVFADGPKPTGLRYCINSASLRFIPKEDLEKEGYEEYVKLFTEGEKNH